MNNLAERSGATFDIPPELVERITELSEDMGFPNPAAHLIEAEDVAEVNQESPEITSKSLNINIPTNG